MAADQLQVTVCLAGCWTAEQLLQLMCACMSLDADIPGLALTFEAWPSLGIRAANVHRGDVITVNLSIGAQDWHVLCGRGFHQTLGPQVRDATVGAGPSCSALERPCVPVKLDLILLDSAATIVPATWLKMAGVRCRSEV